LRPPGAGPRCLPPPASRRHQAIGGGPDQRVWRLGWGRVSKSGADRSPTHQNAVSNLPNVRCADQKRGRGPSPHPHRWSVPAVTVAPRGGRAATVSHSAEDGGQRVRGRLLFWVRGVAGPAAGAPPPRARGWQQGARGGRATSGGESLGRGTSTGCGWQRNQWVAPAGQQPSAAARTHPQRQTGVGWWETGLPARGAAQVPAHGGGCWGMATERWAERRATCGRPPHGLAGDCSGRLARLVTDSDKRGGCGAGRPVSSAARAHVAVVAASGFFRACGPRSDGPAARRATQRPQ